MSHSCKLLLELEKLLLELDKLLLNLFLRPEIDLFIYYLQKSKQDALEFNKGLWKLLSENVIVHRDKYMTFRFKGGIEIKVETVV